MLYLQSEEYIDVSFTFVQYILLGLSRYFFLFGGLFWSDETYFCFICKYARVGAWFVL